MCNEPTYFKPGGQIPGVSFGDKVNGVPPDIDRLYAEARACTSAGAYTPAVLACRKILMHIAVAEGAAPGESFLQYVTFLASKGYVPPKGQGWVDHIRRKGNEANHDIVLMTDNDAKDLVSFVEMLLLFIYDFPSRVPSGPAGGP